MWSGLESVGVVFIVFCVGFFFEYRRIWPERTPDGLSVVIVKLSAPCLAVTSITAGFTREMLASSLVLLLIAALHLVVLFAISKISSRLLRMSGGKKTVYEVTFTFSNVIFIGLPINQIVFGEKGLPFLFAYYIVILAAFWGFGASRIAAAEQDKEPRLAAPQITAAMRNETPRMDTTQTDTSLPDKFQFDAERPSASQAHEFQSDAGQSGASQTDGFQSDAEHVDTPKSDSGQRPSGDSSKTRLSKIFNPGFIGVLIGAGLVQAGLHLPSVVDTALGYLANLTVPLSMLVIGANLTVFAKGIPRVTFDEVMIMLGKFMISPLVMFGLLKLFGIEGMPFGVFMLVAVMPCHMQTSILAQHHGVESAYASKLVGLSTLLSCVAIPIFVLIIHRMM